MILDEILVNEEAVDFSHRFDFHISLFIHRCYDAAVATVVAEFAEIDALPGAEVEAATGDGDGEAHTEE